MSQLYILKTLTAFHKRFNYILKHFVWSLWIPGPLGGAMTLSRMAFSRMTPGRKGFSPLGGAWYWTGWHSAKWHV